MLAQAIIREGMKNVAAGANPIIMKKGIEKAVARAVEEIRKMAKPIESKEAIAQVASISAADSTIGDLIADAMDKVGNDGVITVEESKTMATTLEVVEYELRSVISLLLVTGSEDGSRTERTVHLNY